MANAHVTAQTDHMPGMEDIARQSVGLAQMQLAPFAGDDARRILSAVLQTSNASYND